MQVTQRSNRPTPAQDHIICLVELYPGMVQLQIIDRWTTQNGHSSRNFGYRAVDRAVSSRRIKRVWNDKQTIARLYPV